MELREFSKKLIKENKSQMSLLTNFRLVQYVVDATQLSSANLLLSRALPPIGGDLFFYPIIHFNNIQMIYN